MKIKISFSILFVYAFISSCEFSPHELPFEDVQPLTQEPALNIDIQNINENDTIVSRFNDIILNIETLTSGKRVISFSLQRDYSTPYEYESIPNQLSFPIQVQPDGLSKITLRLAIGTGTNSLADQLDAEGYITEYAFYIYKVPYNTDSHDDIHITETIDDGRLKVAWPRYIHPDFQSYKINGITLKDQNQNYYIDSNFVEGNSKHYSLIINASDRVVGRKDFFSSLNEVMYPSVHVLVKNDTVMVSWAKSQFYNNFYKYTIYSPFFGPQQQNTAFYESTNINDTSCTITNIPFGRYINIDVRYVANNMSQTIDKVAGSRNGYRASIGEYGGVPEYADIYMNPQDSSILVREKINYQLFLYNEETAEQTNNTDWVSDLIIFKSQNGKHWGTWRANTINKFNPKTFEAEVLFDLKTFIAHKNNETNKTYFLNNAACDDLGNYYFTLYDSQSNEYFNFKYTPSTDLVSQLSVTDNKVNTTLLLEISHDGQFAICRDNSDSGMRNNYLYKVNNKVLTKVNQIGASEFIPLKNQVIDKQGTTISTYNLSDFSQLSEFKISGSIDNSIYTPNNKYVIYQDENHFYNELNHIIDIETGQEVGTFYGEALHIITGKFIYNKHRRLKLWLPSDE